MTNMKPLPASFFLHGTGAVVLFYFSISWGASSVAGIPYESEAVKVHKGDMVLECPVGVDIRETKHSVVIKQFDPGMNYTGEVLGCDWLRRKQNFDCLPSRFGAELLKIQADRVLVRLPEDRVDKRGFYRCQLVPPESDKPFKTCRFPSPDVSQEISTTVVPAPVDHHKTEAPKGLGHPPSYGTDAQDFECIHKKLTAAVAVLSIIVIILLFVTPAAIRRLHSEYRKHGGVPEKDMLYQERKRDRYEPQSHETSKNGQPSLTIYCPSTSPLMPDSDLTVDLHVERI